MTDITLNFWTKSSPGNKIERVYINAGSNSLAHIARRQTFQDRDPRDSYYSAHRVAHGDTIEVDRDVVRWAGTDDMLDAVLTTLGSSRFEWNTLSDDYERFAFFAKRARNGWPNWYGNTPKTEAKRLQRERDTAVYQLALPA